MHSSTIASVAKPGRPCAPNVFKVIHNNFIIIVTSQMYRIFDAQSTSLKSELDEFTLRAMQFSFPLPLLGTMTHS